MAKYKIIPSSRTIVQSPISIGHKAEKGVEAIEFDLTAWVETYGSGTLTVIMRRWGDAIPYPIALEIDENNKATWTLSDIDTAKAGMAYAQLNYIVGDEVVKKSDIYTFRVMDSLTGEGEPPEAYESWLEHLTHLAAEAMAEVLDIEGVVTDKTLTVNGGIADAKATGDALSALEDQFSEETDKLKADLGDVIENFPSELTAVNIGNLEDGVLSQAHIVNATGMTFRHSADITVNSGDVYRLTCSGNTTFCPFMFFSKSNNSYTLIATYYTISGDTSTGNKYLVDYTVTVPDNATVLCLNIFQTAGGHVYSVKKQTLADITQIENQIDEKVDKYGVMQITPNNTTFFDNINVFDRLKSEPRHTWASTDGIIQSAGSTKWSLVIPVEPDTTYAIRIPSVNRQIYVESETNDFTVGQTYTKLTHLATTSEWRLLRTGNTAKYIMWHFYNGDYDYDANVDGICVLKANAIPSGNQIPTPTVKLNNLPTNVLAGKTAVIFGTSITSDAVHGIPNYIRSITGLTLICESLGSSCARRGWASRETADDPYGWTGTSWQNVFLAMGANLTEKQDLIDNYESKWADLLGGDYEGASGDGTGTGKPQTLSAEWIAKIKGASYENKLIPYLDGTKDMPDLFIFEHGHNDYEVGMSGLVANENSLDMSTYAGAMYFYFNKIFEANPQAKIMVLSHYENTSAKGKTIFDAMKELANYHGVAFCNVADALAWSQRLVTTTGYWNQSTHLWVPSGGASQTITRRQQALFDDLHPHNDWSGNASRREASIASDYMIANKRFLFGT